MTAAALVACGAASEAAETVAEIRTARGQTVRALVEKPAGPPLGCVVLLAGGHGNLALRADGKIGWGAGNQLVRTRSDYARAGFVAVTPDIAADLKDGSGGRSGYRWSAEHAGDLGSVIRHARSLVGTAPVHLVATSRGALSAAKTGATQTKGPERPDSIVITAGMTVAINDTQPSAQSNVPGLGKITQPVLLLYHAKDGCTYTPASSARRFKPLLTGARRVDIKIIDGGEAGDGDPCEARSHHGFLGQDQEVVEIISGWLKGLAR